MQNCAKTRNRSEPEPREDQNQKQEGTRTRREQSQSEPGQDMDKGLKTLNLTKTRYENYQNRTTALERGNPRMEPDPVRTTTDVDH